jgi:homoserine dehydrogenase
MTTHKTTEQNIQQCLKIINNDKTILEFPTLIRIF